MALIDSSVWIDYFTERPLPHAEILAARLDGGLPVATTGIVMQELLARAAKGVADLAPKREVLLQGRPHLSWSLSRARVAASVQRGC